MTPGVHRRLVALVCGASLSTLFFYPLLQALDNDVYYLLWQREDTFSFALAFTLLVLLCVASWYGLDRIENHPRVRLCGLLLLSVIPLASFAAAIVRQVPVKEDLIPLVARPGTVVGAAILAATLGLLAPGAVAKTLRGLILVLSPVALMAGAAFVTLGSYESHPAAYETSGPGPVGSTAPKPSVIVLLFDELSFRFLYHAGQVRPDLANVRRLSERATNYLAARAPGTETITSVPSLLASREFLDVDAKGNEIFEVRPGGNRVPLDLRRPDGLFGRARTAGLRTEVVGYYFPYCRLLDGVADSCRSFSWYNYSSVDPGVSLLNPLWTNLILWPYQPPFGVLKMPAFNQLQRRITDQTAEAALAGLESRQPRFRFVHFSVPHLPFVFDRGGYRPATAPMRKDEANYQRQLAYVDTLIGRLLDGIERVGLFESSVVVIMSDHEYRWPGMVPSEVSHIPLIVKRPGQTTREDVSTQVRAELILASLFSPQ